jgi:hypothetical protein
MLDRQQLMPRSLYDQAKEFFWGMSQRQMAVLVLIAYFLLAMVMTWPLMAQLGEVLPWNNRGDHWMHQWTYWWVLKALSEGQNPFYTRLLYYPEGVSLITHNIAWLNIIFWIPLQALVGGFTATNLIYIGLFAINGFAMYLLIRELVGSQPASIIGGLIFAFWPYLTSQTGHPNSIIAFWLPLSLLFLNRTLENGRTRDAFLTGIFLALGGIGRWQLLIAGSLLLISYLFYKCLPEARCLTRRTLSLLLLTGSVALILMAPFAFPVIVGLPEIAQFTEYEGLVRSTSRGGDLLAYFVPNQTLTIGDVILNDLPDRLTFNNDQMEYLGLTTLALAIYGGVKRWKSARFWTLMALVYFILALGPELEIGQVFYPQVPMPYRLIEDWNFIRIIAFPHRFNTYLGIPVAMLAALGVASLIRQRARSWKSVTLVAILGLLILVEYALLPYPTAEGHTPDWYTQLAQEPGQFAIVDLPMDRQFRDKFYMHYQITHGKALVEGHVSRVTPEANDFLDNSPFLARLREANVMDPWLGDVRRQLQSLSEADIRYLVLHKGFVRPEQLEQWQRWLPFEPTYEDDELIVYRTDPRLGQDYEITQMMGDHIGLIRADDGPVRVNQGDYLWVTAQWASEGQPSHNYQACAELIDRNGEVAERECQPLLKELPASQWSANEVVNGGAILQPDPFLSPGTYSRRLSLVNEQNGAILGRPLFLGPVEIEALPRVYEAPDPTHSLHVRWADEISLPGYDLQESDTTLLLTLYWQSLKRSPPFYKVFAHVIDQETGAVVAQVDTVPRNWSYPTTWWDEGEIVEETLEIDIEGLPTGQYRLQIGFYDPDPGERIPAFSADGQPYPDNAVPLSFLER